MRINSKRNTHDDVLRFLMRTGPVAASASAGYGTTWSGAKLYGSRANQTRKRFLFWETTYFCAQGMPSAKMLQKSPRPPCSYLCRPRSIHGARMRPVSLLHPTFPCSHSTFRRYLDYGDDVKHQRAARRDALHKIKPIGRRKPLCLCRQSSDATHKVQIDKPWLP
jgi:hypothetical protein